MSANRLSNEPPILSGQPLHQAAEPPVKYEAKRPLIPVNSTPIAIAVADVVEDVPSNSTCETNSCGTVASLLPIPTSSATTTPSLYGATSQAATADPLNLLPQVVPPILNTATTEHFRPHNPPPTPAIVFVKTASPWRRILRAPFYWAARSLDLMSLLVLIAIVAAIPLVQFVSLGYLLVAGSRLADGRPWRQSLPGLRLAGRIGVFALWTGLLVVPVLLVADIARSAELLEPGSSTSKFWRVSAFLTTAAWLIHAGWAAMRGGRWWHLIWPAPFKCLKQIWRPSTWSKASDQLYDFVAGLQLPKLWWLGARATIGALLWLVIPVSMMIIGQRAQEVPIAPFIGIVGAILMAWVMFYLPFFQLIFAQSGSMKSFLAIGQVRRNYSYAPWAHTMALVALSTLAIPLYLLRIEATPSELTWLPSLVFALLMLPSKLLLGWAIGYADSRKSRMLNKRPWWSRIPAKVVGLSAIGFYVGALYVAQLIAAQGAYVMYFQHAFLVPNPLFTSN